MSTTTQIRMCQIGACSEPVHAGLLDQGVCLSHYLDEAFTRVSAAQRLCRERRALDSETLLWLRAQGDFAVTMLADDRGPSSQARSRLLELLLCLANVQEFLRQCALEKT